VVGERVGDVLGGHLQNTTRSGASRWLCNVRAETKATIEGVPVLPDIRFCTATDGTKLAVGTYGIGPPLVRAGTWLTHVEYDATSSQSAHWCEELARRHRYVVYDSRGCGLSDREVSELSLDVFVSDLEAVVDGLGLERFPLFGMSMGAPVAVAYAVKHPERVSRLVLHGGFYRSYISSNHPDPRVLEEADILVKSARLGWGTGSPALRQVFAAKFMGESTEAQRQAFDERQRVTSTAEMAERYLRAMFALDVKDLAPHVTCPTIAFHSRDDQLIFFDQGRKLAALIPGARFVPLDSKNHVPFREEPAWQTVVAGLRPFLDDDAGPRAHAPVKELTARQLDVLRGIARGLTDKEIAGELSLSPRTVEMHVSRALAALESANRAEAVRRAAALGLLD
jgi:pimeloyl-ACP methyl ester carboxylesterase/DNA-binding CsgD family transcriptional regulator